MICKNCGKEIKEGNTFCTNCGSLINTISEDIQNKKKYIISAILLLVTIISVICIGIIPNLLNEVKQEERNRLSLENINVIENQDITNQQQEIDNSISSKIGSTSSKEQKEELPIATIKVKDYGTMEIELYYNEAPNTVKNFIALANNGFYDNLTFHRIVKDFVIQGGDRNGNGTGNATLSSIDKKIEQGSSQDKEYSIEGEFTKNNVTNNIKFEKGVIAMARSDYSSYGMATEGYNSASSQFFIMTEDTPSLNGEYAAFGKVIEGTEVLEKLNNIKTSSNTDKPINPPVIESIRVDTKNEQYDLPETRDVFDLAEYLMNMYYSEN